MWLSIHHTSIHYEESERTLRRYDWDIYSFFVMAGMRIKPKNIVQTLLRTRSTKQKSIQHAMIFSNSTMTSLFTTFRIILSHCPGVTHFVKFSKTILKQSTEPLPKAHMAGIKV